jgi:hypothetical protein
MKYHLSGALPQRELLAAQNNKVCGSRFALHLHNKIYQKINILAQDSGTLVWTKDRIPNNSHQSSL